MLEDTAEHVMRKYWVQTKSKIQTAKFHQCCMKCGESVSNNHVALQLCKNCAKKWEFCQWYQVCDETLEKKLWSTNAISWLFYPNGVINILAKIKSSHWFWKVLVNTYFNWIQKCSEWESMRYKYLNLQRSLWHHQQVT